MNYASLSEVQSYIPKWRIDADTTPSSTDVTAYVERLSARLDSMAAAQGYSVPIVGDTSLDFLRAVCLSGAAWYVGRTTFPGAEDIWGDYRDEFNQMMADFRAGNAALPDAGSTSSSGLTSNMAYLSAVDASAAAPFFRRSTVF